MGRLENFKEILKKDLNREENSPIVQFILQDEELVEEVQKSVSKWIEVTSPPNWSTNGHFIEINGIPVYENHSK